MILFGLGAIWAWGVSKRRVFGWRRKMCTGGSQVVDIQILSPVCMLFCIAFVCLSLCLFSNRPGIWKDLKTMGSVSLFIFFVTLLVLGRQVRHRLFT